MEIALALTKNNALVAFEESIADQSAYGADWLNDYRKKAIAQFSSLNFPTSELEDWKYTDTRALTKRSYDFFPSTSSIEGISSLSEDDVLHVVFENGKLRDDLSDLDSLPAGTIIGSLANSDANIVQQYLGKALPEKHHGFSALNDAFLSDGLFLHVSENVHIQRPVEVTFLNSTDAVAPLVQPRNLIILGDNSRCDILLRYVDNSQNAYLTNAVDEVFVGGKATLELCKLQEEGEKSGHIGGLFVRQKADSTFTVNTVSLDGQLIRNDVLVELDEPGAECFVNGLTSISGRQHVDHHTQINHNVPNCTSHEHYKSVLDGRSRNIFHGRIVVAKDAQGTDSEQRNQTLLLSRDAEIDTKPQLEIYADDVKCSHGATVGQLDTDSVFYLRSRGIDEQTARGLLTTAFAHEALTGISREGVRTYIETRIGSGQDT